MNKVYLDKEGKVFVNGNEIKQVSSVSVETTPYGTSIEIELSGDYKSDYQSKEKVHSLDECTKG